MLAQHKAGKVSIGAKFQDDNTRAPVPKGVEIECKQYEVYVDDFNQVDVNENGTLDEEELAVLLSMQLGKVRTTHTHAFTYKHPYAVCNDRFQTPLPRKPF